MVPPFLVHPDDVLGVGLNELLQGAGPPAPAAGLFNTSGDRISSSLSWLSYQQRNPNAANSVETP
jgi:hypothetical protein